MHKSMSLKYEPSSEPLHIAAKQLCSGQFIPISVVVMLRVGGLVSMTALQSALNPKP